MLRFLYIVLHIRGIVIHKCTAFIFSVFKLQFCYLSSCLIIPTCYIFYVSNLNVCNPNLSVCNPWLMTISQGQCTHFKRYTCICFPSQCFRILLPWHILSCLCMYDAGSESDLTRRLFIGRVTQINQPQPPYPSLSFCLPFPCSLTLSLGR